MEFGDAVGHRQHQRRAHHLIEPVQLHLVEGPVLLVGGGLLRHHAALADAVQTCQQIADRLVAEAVILGVAHQKIADLQVSLEILIAFERYEAEGEDELEAHLQLAERAALVEQRFDGVFDGILLLTERASHQRVDRLFQDGHDLEKEAARAILLVQSLQYFIFLVCGHKCIGSS